MQAEDKAKEKIDFLLFFRQIKLNCLDDIVDVRCRKNKKHLSEQVFFNVGILGLEPRMTGPESVVLPLHHIPIKRLRIRTSYLCAKVHIFFVSQIFYLLFF